MDEIMIQIHENIHVDTIKSNNFKFMILQVVETEGYRFSESGIFQVPVDALTCATYLAYIRELPLAPRPEIFGLHENADITCDQNESYDLFGTVLSLQPREQTKGGGMSREDIIEKTCLEIQSVTPPVFDIIYVLEEYPTMYEESMNTVLTQECIRYNGLLTIMKISLRESLKALKGLVVMSNDLEMLTINVFNNQVYIIISLLLNLTKKLINTILKNILGDE